LTGPAIRAYRPFFVNAFLRSLRLGLVLAAELLVLGGVLAVGDRVGAGLPGRDLAGWADATAPADAAMAVARLAAVAVCGWLIVTTLAYGVVRLAARRRPGEASGAWSGRLAGPVVRRLVDAALAASVTVTVVGAPAVASATDAPVVSVVRDGHGGGVSQLPGAPASTAAVAREPTTTSPPVPASVPAPPVAASVVVAPGDSLWELAARQVAAASARPRETVGDGEIAPYWTRVCDANRERLASGDVDLIHPGELVILPPLR